MAEQKQAHGDGIVLLDLVPQTQGWLPVKHLVGVVQRLLDAELAAVPGAQPASLDRIAFKFLRRRPVARKLQLLVIAPRVETLAQMAALPGWRRSFGRVSAWVIDSFWTEALSGYPGLRNFDHLFLTWGGDLELYGAATGGTVDWLPWGADALSLGSAAPARSVDVLRLGRQPAAWDDDAASQARLAAAGLSFAGRPVGDDGDASYTALLRDQLRRARCVLAHSNLVGEARYTHPIKEYMTARWTDAFACGCMVAGAQPRTDPLFCRIDPAAVIDLDLGASNGGLDDLRAALEGWTPDRARAIHHMALRDFDWRWRIRDLALRLERSTEKVDAELAEIEARLTATDA